MSADADDDQVARARAQQEWDDLYGWDDAHEHGDERDIPVGDDE